MHDVTPGSARSQIRSRPSKPGVAGSIPAGRAEPEKTEAAPQDQRQPSSPAVPRSASGRGGSDARPSHAFLFAGYLGGYIASRCADCRVLRAFRERPDGALSAIFSVHPAGPWSEVNPPCTGVPS